MDIFMLSVYKNSKCITVGIFIRNTHKYLQSFIFAIIMLNTKQQEQTYLPVNKVPFVIDCSDVTLCAAVSIRAVV